MKRVFKKSADDAVNALLVSARRQRIDLAWDRAEAQQPQCGFGRLSICCDDCCAGPCRTNPFGADDQRTICGRDRTALAAGRALDRIADGTRALFKLARDFGAECRSTTLPRFSRRRTRWPRTRPLPTVC